MTKAPSSVGYLDTLEKYALTQQGVRSGFNTVNYAAQIAMQVFPLKSSQLSVAKGIAEGFSFVADGTFIVDFFVSLRETVDASSKLTRSLLKRNWKVLHVRISRCAYKGLGLVSDAMESVKFLNGVLGISSASRLTLVGSGAGLIRSSLDIKNYLTQCLTKPKKKKTKSFVTKPKSEAQRARSLARRVLKAEKTHLIKLRIVQSAAFCAVDALVLVGTLYATINVGGLVLGSLILGNAMNVRTYFAVQSIQAKERALVSPKVRRG